MNKKIFRGGIPFNEVSKAKLETRESHENHGHNLQLEFRRDTRSRGEAGVCSLYARTQLDAYIHAVAEAGPEEDS